jgi:hypothetical protein
MQSPNFDSKSPPEYNKRVENPPNNHISLKEVQKCLIDESDPGSVPEKKPNLKRQETLTKKSLLR